MILSLNYYYYSLLLLIIIIRSIPGNSPPHHPPQARGWFRQDSQTPAALSPIFPHVAGNPSSTPSAPGVVNVYSLAQHVAELLCLQIKCLELMIKTQQPDCKNNSLLLLLLFQSGSSANLSEPILLYQSIEVKLQSSAENIN